MLPDLQDVSEQFNDVALQVCRAANQRRDKYDKISVPGIRITQRKPPKSIVETHADRSETSCGRDQPEQGYAGQHVQASPFQACDQVAPLHPDGELLSLEDFCVDYCGLNTVHLNGFRTGLSGVYDEDILSILSTFQVLVWCGEDYDEHGFTGIIPRFLEMNSEGVAICFQGFHDTNCLNATWSSTLATHGERIKIVAISLDDPEANGIAADIGDMGDQLGDACRPWPESAVQRFVLGRLALMLTRAKNVVALGGDELVAAEAQASFHEGVKWTVYAISRGKKENFPSLCDLAYRNASNPCVELVQGKDPFEHNAFKASLKNLSLEHERLVEFAQLTTVALLLFFSAPPLRLICGSRFEACLQFSRCMEIAYWIIGCYVGQRSYLHFRDYGVDSGYIALGKLGMAVIHEFSRLLGKGGSLVFDRLSRQGDILLLMVWEIIGVRCNLIVEHLQEVAQARWTWCERKLSAFAFLFRRGSAVGVGRRLERPLGAPCRVPPQVVCNTVRNTVEAEPDHQDEEEFEDSEDGMPITSVDDALGCLTCCVLRQRY